MDAGTGLHDRILVFVPCYNCAKQVGRVMAQVARLPAGWCDEVLVVDNQSRDGTAETAAAALAGVAGLNWKVVRNRDNYNLGGSHKVAFDYAIAQGFTHVVVLHGDDQADIADFMAPVAAGLHRVNDSLLGARFMRGARLQGYSLYRTAGNYGLNAICSVLTRRWIADQGSGLNMYSVSYLRSRFYAGFSDTLIFPNSMFLYGVLSRSKYQFIPISWREEDQVSNAKAVRQALRVIRLAAAPKQVMQASQAGASREYAFDVVHSGGAVDA